MNRTRSTAVILIATALLGTAAALWGCGNGGTPAARTVKVLRGRFEVRVSETCEFKPLNSWVLLSRAGDKIDWILPEGSIVKRGDLVFSQDRARHEDWLTRDSNELEAVRRTLKEVRRQVQMERDQINLDLERKTSAVKLAQTRLDEVRAGPTEDERAEGRAALQAALLAAQDKRGAAAATRKLVEKGFLSKADAAREKLNADIAEIDHGRAELDLARLKAGAGPEAREIARLQLERARAEKERARADADRREAELAGRITDAQGSVASLERNVARAKRQIAARQVRAKGSGVVIYRNMHHRRASKPEVGSRIWRGAGVVDIANLSRMKIRTQMAERYIRHLRVGSIITVKPTPLAGVALRAKVTWIDRWSRDRSADLAKADRAKQGMSGVKVFALEAALTRADPRIKPGFKGQAEFPLVDIPDALIVPTAAVFGGPRGRFVMRSAGKEVQRVAVEIIADDGLKAAVRGELSAGQEILTREGL